jgi:hypothetical protein
MFLAPRKRNGGMVGVCAIIPLSHTFADELSEMPICKLGGDFRQLKPLRSHLSEDGARFAIGRNLRQLEAWWRRRRIALVCRLIGLPSVVAPVLAKA